MSSFRFLDLPGELRLRMYQYCLPWGGRLHLDPDNVQFPIPYEVPESYDSTFGLVRTCKKLHVEVTEFIYSHNTVNIIVTKEAGDFLTGLGSQACYYISKLECHVTEGLCDLGSIWATLATCPRLTDVRLVFYHEKTNWSMTLAQLAVYQASNQPACRFDLDIELHTSVWAHHSQRGRHGMSFRQHVEDAKRHARVYSYRLPNQLRHITITASVSWTAAQELSTRVSLEQVSGEHWEFRPFSKDDTKQKKTLRLGKVLDKPTAEVDT